MEAAISKIELYNIKAKHDATRKLTVDMLMFFFVICLIPNLLVKYHTKI